MSFNSTDVLKMLDMLGSVRGLLWIVDEAEVIEIVFCLESECRTEVKSST